MSKILFISTRYPYPIFGGDKLRSHDILKFLSKKNKIDLVCLNKEKKIEKKLKFCKNIKVFHLNIFFRIFNILFSFLKLEPLQNGYYFSSEMKNYINDVKNEYDVIICHLLRASQYLPDNYTKKKILDSTDLLSSNYKQSIEQLSIINPLKYIYILEKILVDRYENKIFKKFNNIVFVSNSDARKAKKKVPKKSIIKVVENSKSFEFKLFKHKKNNKKIIFVGNIKYLPNKLACFDFTKNVLEKINLRYPEIEFHIIGDISVIDKFLLEKNKNVIVHGKVNNLKNVLKNSICGLCNVQVTTGFQNKILTYMSYGLPTILSFNSFVKTRFEQNKEVLVFKNNKELIRNIFQLKQNKKLAEKLGTNSEKIVKKRYNSNKVLPKYSKII